MKNIVKEVIPMNNGIFSHIDYEFLDFQPSELDILFITRCGMRTVGPVVRIMQDEPSDILTQDQLTQLGSLILKMYKVKWDKISRLIDLEYDPIHNFSDATTEQISDSTDEESGLTTRHTDTVSQSEVLAKDSTVTTVDDFEKNDTGQNDIYGFNSVTAVGDRTDALKETNEGTRTVTEDVDSTNTITGSSSKTGNDSAEKHNEYTRSRSLSRNGNIGNITTQQLMAEEIELWRWNYIEEVLNDVKDFLTIPVYD